jgi:hypothetical protein
VAPDLETAPSHAAAAVRGSESHAA